MSGLADTFQVVAEGTINGRAVKFARLLVGRDLALLAGNVITERQAAAVEEFKAANEQAIKLNLPPMSAFELFTIKQKIRDEQPSIPELYARAKTPTGARATVLLSLERAGYNAEDRLAIVGDLEAAEMMQLATDLITCKRVETPKEAEPPLASTPASPSDAGPQVAKTETLVVQPSYPG